MSEEEITPAQGSNQLAYSKEYQTKILAYMMADPQFSSLAKDAIGPEQFSDRCLQWYFRTISACPSVNVVIEEFRKACTHKVIKEEERQHYVNVFKEIKKEPVPVEKEHIRSTMGTFIKSQNLKRALMKSANLIKEGKYEEILGDITEAVHSGVDVLDMGHDYFKDFEDRLERRKNTPLSKRISTGIPELDHTLGGGITNKQLGMVVGGTGRGKSLMLSWMAHNAILRGKKVVYFTHEMSEELVADRFDSLMCHVKPQEINEMHEEIFEQMNQYKDRFGTSLIIKEYPAMMASVETLKSYLMQLANLGVYPDLVIVDYIDLLKPTRYYGDATQEMDVTTKSLHGMSKELDIAIWTATQLNRSGFSMDNPDETAIAGAIAKLYTVDIALFLAQTPEERKLGELRILMNKVRGGPAGGSIRIETNYGYLQFYERTINDEGDEVEDEPSDDRKV